MKPIYKTFAVKEPFERVNVDSFCAECDRTDCSGSSFSLRFFNSFSLSIRKLVFCSLSQHSQNEETKEEPKIRIN